jgi:hypothetical protein
MNENEYIGKNFGKWSQPGVPHKGWTCIDIEDIGEPSAICEMCEKQSIRYIHYMEHPDYGDTLRVGCICAGHMEDDLISAQRRDDFMKSRSSKRKKWIDRNWKISAKGNSYIKSDGYIIVMKCQDTYWSALIQSEDKTFEKWSQRKYKSKNEAKLAAFDYLTKILSEKEIK